MNFYMAGSYNIVEKPVIQVGMSDGSTRELSLTDTFARATDISELRGSPTHVFALHRLLQAILLRAVESSGDVDIAPWRRWAELWDAFELPLTAIDEYLEEHHDRFDILDSRAPFMQVADLHTSKTDAGTTATLDRLLMNSSEDALFSMRRGKGIQRLEFAAAARELVHAHAYAVSGIYPGGRDGDGPDSRTKNGKVYPQGTGPLGDLGGVIVEGESLKQTLLLNLVLGKSAHEPFNYDIDDQPVWERAPLGASEEDRQVPGPVGIADLFTWQSRRIRLFSDDDGVTGAVMCYGDKLRPQNLHTVETMSAFKKSKNQSTASNTVYMPVRHQPSRVFWRGLGGLLTRTGVTDHDIVTPRTLRWLAEMREQGALNESFVIRTHAVGMAYGTQSSVVDEVYDDHVGMQIDLLQDRDGVLAGVALEMVESTEQAVRALGRLAENVAVAAGADPHVAAKSAQERAKTLAFSRLDLQFRNWLLTLDADTVVDTARSSWSNTARTVLEGCAGEIIGQASQTAWVGRSTATDSDDVINIPKASVWFRRQLSRALPVTSPKVQQNQSSNQCEKEQA